jgi:hypothetical protein
MMLMCHLAAIENGIKVSDRVPIVNDRSTYLCPGVGFEWQDLSPDDELGLPAKPFEK